MPYRLPASARPFLPPLAILCVALCLPSSAAAEPLPAVVEFNRDIRPILSDNCYTCHGPDKARRKANFRLDTEEGAFADRGDHRVLVPGDPGKSELFRRITADDGERMPPAKSARSLSGRQIDLVRRWIEQGAKWQKHWSLLPPTRPRLPPVKNVSWPHNGIDHFILARLEQEGLTPSPEADRVTLLRRVTLDLTGLPPTPAEVDDFLADTSPAAYEKVVDRLLASPRYGERFAIPSLDAARYADTNGYQTDGERVMWRWRDWVIDAYNRNLPFDQFTVEQLAGDLLPHATLQQKIATGFNRNHRGNSEGGIVPEEYAVEYVVDRVETTATVWLGLTLGCARCHDHKYDPFKQKEFYQLFAYFNNVPEKGRALKYGNSPPYIKAPTPRQQEQLQQLEQELAEAEGKLARLEPELAAAQEKWEKSLRRGQLDGWSIERGLVAAYDLDGNTVGRAGRARLLPSQQRPEKPTPVADAPGSPKLPEGKFHDGEPTFATGRLGQAAVFDGKRYLDAGNVAGFGFYDKFSCAAWVYPSGEQGGTILSRMTDEEQADGYYLVLHKGKLQVNLVKRWLDDAIRVETERSLPAEEWHHVVATYDGSRTAGGVRVYIEGKEEKLRVVLDELNQTFYSDEPLRIGGGGGPKGRFHGLLDDVRIYHRVLAAEEASILATIDPVAEIAALPAAQRSRAQSDKLRACFLDGPAPDAIRQAEERVLSLRQQKEEFVESIPTCMVMEEMPQPRTTHIMIRGAYDRPGDVVTPGVPASLLTPGAGVPGSHGVPNNRLGFARWLVDRGNPLTARVAVNRFWQMYFGIGLVKTVGDFGSQGEWPSHPELLDWLACEFLDSTTPSPPNPLSHKGERGSKIDSPLSPSWERGAGGVRGWDMKALQRLIVTSAAYRQSSRLTPRLLQLDPDNRLLARGPRFRLPATTIRDQALAASGLLVAKLGGPSVKPYQPEGLVKELTGTEDYKQDHGENLYRRSLYTFWKRTVAPPAMVTFDAAGRETCVVRETRTNTPLQALTLMNDVAFVEAARNLAQRALLEGGATAEERLTLAFRLVLARRPSEAELRVLRAGLEQHLADYRKDREAARKLVSQGESRWNEKLDVAELAAYTTVAGLILNLDESITKE
jgi:hypothetical protein